MDLSACSPSSRLTRSIVCAYALHTHTNLTLSLPQPCLASCSLSVHLHVDTKVIFVAGIAAGSGISTYLSSQTATVSEVAPLYAVLGGFMFLFGSRVAAGSLDSHAVGGVALLSIKSVIAVCIILVAGCATQSLL